MGGAPKRHAVGSPQSGEFDSTDAIYVVGSESESEDDDICVVCDDEGPAPGTSKKISGDDQDEEQHTWLGMCAVNLKRMSLGTDRDSPSCLRANKKEQPGKRNVEHPKRTTRNVFLTKIIDRCCLFIMWTKCSNRV